MSEKKRHALVVGIGHYDAPGMSLSWVAELVAQIFVELRNRGFNVVLLPTDGTVEKMQDKSVSDAELIKAIVNVVQNTSVSSNELRKAVVETFNPPTKNIKRYLPNTALFFFLGHGKRDKYMNEGYLVTSDADVFSGHYGVSLASLGKQLQESPIPEQIVWLDCCYSGELFNCLGDDLSVGKNRCFITSTEDFKETPAEGRLTKSLLELLKQVKDCEELLEKLQNISDNLTSQSFQFLPPNKRGNPIHLTGQETPPEFQINRYTKEDLNQQINVKELPRNAGRREKEVDSILEILKFVLKRKEVQCETILSQFGISPEVLNKLGERALLRLSSTPTNPACKVSLTQPGRDYIFRHPY